MGTCVINIFVVSLLGCTDYFITFNSNELIVATQALSTVLGTQPS